MVGLWLKRRLPSDFDFKASLKSDLLLKKLAEFLAHFIIALKLNWLK